MSLRTKSQMIDKVQRWLVDAGADTYGDTLVAGMLESAANSVWELMIAEPDHSRRRCLRTFSSWAASVAEQETYDLPANCLLLDEVQIRWRDDDDRWTTLPYRRPPAGAVRSGTASILSTYGAAAGLLGWYDDEEEGTIRIWPELQSVNEEKVRFRYYHLPTFPASNDETFNSQGGETVDNLPEGVDELCEYFAAALLAHEELEDGKPIGAFGRLFVARYDSFTRGRGAGKTRTRRRILLK